jgi:hypothetical protein
VIPVSYVVASGECKTSSQPGMAVKVHSESNPNDTVPDNHVFVVEFRND